jgi:hypothetical protein
MEPRYPGCHVKLVGEDGNAFFIMGRVGGALRKHLRGLGWTNLSIDGELATFYEQAKSGDYDHLLQTVMAWVDTD